LILPAEDALIEDQGSNPFSTCSNISHRWMEYFFSRRILQIKEGRLPIRGAELPIQ
jgi:hypothetical protein